MGTRASYWIGDPRDYENREYLASTCYDGYPNGILKLKDLAGIKTAEEFRAAVSKLSCYSDYFVAGHGYFPWKEDIFLTDYTYAFMDGKVYIHCNYRGKISVEELLEGKKYPEKTDHSYRGIWLHKPDEVIMEGRPES